MSIVEAATSGLEIWLLLVVVQNRQTYWLPIFWGAGSLDNTDSSKIWKTGFFGI